MPGSRPTSRPPSRQGSRTSAYKTPSYTAKVGGRGGSLSTSTSKPKLQGKKSQSSTQGKKRASMEGYCGQQQTIEIPPQLPDILKQYAKGAMRTQPLDLLMWSGAYFRAMANGEALPVKDRLENVIFESSDGLTPGLLRVLDTQLGGKAGLKVAVNDVLKKWRGFGLSQDAFEHIVLKKARMDSNNVVEWDNLMAVMASTIGKNLAETMRVICEVLTDQPDGMEPLVDYKTWWNMYTYLVELNGGIPPEKIQAVNDYLLPASNENSGHIGPKDFTNGRCPPLE